MSLVENELLMKVEKKKFIVINLSFWLHSITKSPLLWSKYFYFDIPELLCTYIYFNVNNHVDGKVG